MGMVFTIWLETWPNLYIVPPLIPITMDYSAIRGNHLIGWEEAFRECRKMDALLKKPVLEVSREKGKGSGAFV